MNLPLDTVLCLLAAVPAGICLAQGKDGATKAWCAGLLVVTLAIGLRHWIAPLGHLVDANIYKGSTCAAAIIAIVCGVRIADGIFATLMITGTLLMALLSLGLIGG